MGYSLEGRILPPPPYIPRSEVCTMDLQPASCEDRVLDGPASGEKGSKGRN